MLLNPFIGSTPTVSVVVAEEIAGRSEVEFDAASLGDPVGADSASQLDLVSPLLPVDLYDRAVGIICV